MLPFLQKLSLLPKFTFCTALFVSSMQYRIIYRFMQGNAPLIRYVFAS